jgi:hypothetical protein
MASNPIRALLAFAAWLPATAAMAALAPPRTDFPPDPAAAAASAAASTHPVSPVTVEATKPAEMERQAYRFVESYAATTERLDQLARWDGPICVSVKGLQPDAAAPIQARVEAMAASLGISVLPAGCAHNIEIVVTDKPQAFMDKVAAEHEQLLGYRHRSERNRLKTVTHPIQAWYVTGTGGAGGNPVGMTFANIGTALSVPNAIPAPSTHGLSMQAPRSAVDDEDGGRGPTGCADAPAFTSCLASVFLHVIVVVDINRVQNISLNAIADYVALLSLSQPKSFDACYSLPSVMDLFAKSCGPGRDGAGGLTRADSAYLTALYKVDPEKKKMGQEADMASLMAGSLIKADAADRTAVEGATAQR